MERDFQEKDRKGSTCRFVLGTRTHALRYIHQFTEIFTEEGRKPVKITHLVPNQKSRVTFTPGMRERLNERAAQMTQLANGGGGGQQQPTPGAATATAGASTSNQANPSPVKKPALVQTSILQQTLTQGSIASSPSTPGTPPTLPLHPVNIATVTAAASSRNPSAAVLPQTPISHSALLPLTPHPQQQPPPSIEANPSSVASAASNENSNFETASTSNGPATASTPNNNSNGGGGAGGGGDEIAIQSIMQSLIKDSAQFEQEHHKKPPPPPAGSTPPAIQGALVGVGGASLPTAPVPQASLANVVSVSGSPVKLPTQPTPPPLTQVATPITNPNANSKLVAKQVTLQNILLAQQQQGGGQNNPPGSGDKMVKVSMSQLAAQLSRPSASGTATPVTITTGSGNLPSYSQALADQQQQKSIQSSPRARLLVTQPQLVRSLSQPVSNEKAQQSTSSASDSPTIQSLLSNSNPPSVSNDDISSASTSGPGGGGGGILERLVTGQIVATTSTSDSVANNNSNPAAVADSTNNEPITLAALLSKPAQNASTPAASPTKASPLIQQLQQPIPPPKVGGGPSSSNQSNPTTASPQRGNQQPPPQSSPRLISASAASTLQQQLMQQGPPKQGGVATAAGTAANHVQQLQPVQNGGTPNGATVTALQNLLASGQALNTITTSSNIPLQLHVPGISSPVTLSFQDGSNATAVATGSAAAVQNHNHVATAGSAAGDMNNKAALVPATSNAVVTVAAATSGGVLIPNNLIQLPQQLTGTPGAGGSAQQRAIAISAGGRFIKAAGAQLAQSAPGQPLYVQMPAGAKTQAGQQIQIVRSIDNNQQPITLRQVQPQYVAAGAGAPGSAGAPSLVLNSVKSSPGLVALPQQPQVVLQAAPMQTPGQPRQVAIQQAPGAPAGLLTGVPAGVAGNSKGAAAAVPAPGGAGVVQNNQILMARQKRKQSLK